MKPDQLQQPSTERTAYTGPAVAASLSVLLAFFTLMVSHHISRLSPGLDNMVHSFGYWIPGSQGSGPDGSIGSYTGKETLALFVWFVSWLLFHVLWRKQNLSLSAWTKVFIAALGLITLGFFHPLSDPIVLFIAALF
ncbi:hypothetical protein [Methylomonas fluvii]|uniref:Uncharacterized protein n=1 Tax=Methylomonas fluvii TaxID=1854564 RepID=A0ABR9DKU5_9GAMM|nr:hypothetical protein [Methylomonas fluvii]MBD9363732.1 hypothetical protein [Methylomonas fluvii]